MTYHYAVWMNGKEILIKSVARVVQTTEDITFFNESDEIEAFFRRKFINGIIRLETQDEAPMTDLIKFESSSPVAEMPAKPLVAFAKESTPSNIFGFQPCTFDDVPAKPLVAFAKESEPSELMGAELPNPFGEIPERSNGCNPPIEVEFAKESEPSEPKPYLGYMLEPLQPQNETPITETKSEKEQSSQGNPFGRFLGSPFG